MPIVNLIKVYVNLENEVIESVNPNVQARTSNANQIQIVTPLDKSLNATITFLLNNGRSVSWKDLSYLGTEQVEVSEGVFEEWNVYSYDVASNILSTVTLKTSSPLYYQGRFREEDEDFIGIFTTTNSVLDDTDEALINAELKAEYGVLDSGKFITVTNTIEEASTTYQSNGVDYVYLGFEKPQYIQVILTPKIQLSISPSINSQETQLSASEIDIIRSWIEDLSGEINIINDKLKTTADGVFDITDDNAYSSDKRTHNHLENSYMRIDKYDTNGTESVSKARNLKGTSENITADEVIAKSKLLDQSVKVADNVEFAKVTTNEVDYNKGNVGGKNTWNNQEQCIDTVISSDVTLQNGRELLKLGVNKTGVTITNGTVVAIIGATGQTAQIEPVDINDYNQSFKVIGIATEDIVNNGTGNVTLIGRVRGLDTSAFAEGTILFAGENGTLTDTCPTKPKRCILMAVVETSNAGDGILWAWPRPIASIEELSNVSISNPQDGDFLVFNNDNQRYETLNINNYDITQRVLNDLSDVDAESPEVGEVLGWNGLKWTAGDIATQGAGKSITYFLEDINSSIAPYETLSDIPLGLVEEDDSATLNSGDGEVELGSYITEELGRTKLEAGNWRFETYARNSLPNKVSNIVHKVYKRASNGTETLLFQITSEDITSNVNQLYSTLTTQSEFALVATDRLLVKYYATTTSVSNITVTLVHSGTEFASHIDTPLQTKHNDLAGIQGGATNERYHLSLAELTKLQSEVVTQDLSGYTEDLLLNGDEKFYMEDGTTPKRTTPNALATYIGGLSGSVIDTGKYYGSGLGSHDTALVKIFSPTNAVNADLDLDLLDTSKITDFYTSSGLNKILRIKIPETIVDTTQVFRLTLDPTSGTPTYKNIILNGIGYTGNDILGKDITLKYTTNGFEILDEDGIEATQSYISRIDSTFGVLAPINGSGMDIVAYGGTLYNAVKGDLPADNAEWSLSNATGTPDNFTATSQGGAVQQLINRVSGQKYFIVARVKTSTSGVVYLSSNNSVIGGSTPHSGSGNYELLSVIYTSPATSVWNVGVIDNAISGWTPVEVDYVMTFPISNTIYENYTAQDFIDMDLSYFENELNVEDFELQSVGVNRFDKEDTVLKILDGWSFGDATFEITNTGLNFTSNTAFNGVMIPVTLKPNTSYYFDYSTTKTFRWSVKPRVGTELFDNVVANKFTPDNFTTIDNVDYWLILDDNGTVGTHEITNLILNEGTTAKKHVPYNSQTQKLITTLPSAGLVRSKAYYNNGKWYNDNAVLIETGVAIGATINDTLLPLIDTNASIFEAYDEVTGERQQGVYGDTLTLTNTATVHYQTASPTPTEIDSDGTLICEEITTIIQKQTLTTQVDVTYPLDKDKQLELLSDKVVYLQNEIDKLENNKVDKDGSKVLSDENYTTTEKLKLESIETGAEVNQDDPQIKLQYEANANTNAYTDNEKTKLAGIETGATADQTAEEIKTAYESNNDTNAYTDDEKATVAIAVTHKTLKSTSTTVPSTDEGSTANVTLSESMDNYTHLEIDIVDGTHVQTLTIPVTTGFNTTLQYWNSQTSYKNFNIRRLSSTTIVVDECKEYTFIVGTNPQILQSGATSTITKFRGINK